MVTAVSLCDIKLSLDRNGVTISVVAEAMAKGEGWGDDGADSGGGGVAI